MSLEDKFLALQENLYKPLLFFIPKSIIPKDQVEFIELHEIGKLFNKVVLIEHNGASYELKYKPKLFQLLAKSSYLDKNLFALLDYKANLKAFQFDYLLQKYIVQLKFYIFISSWMDENLNAHITGVEDNISVYFSIQKTSFLQHKKSLKRTFLLNEFSFLTPEEIVASIRKDIPPIPLFDKTTNKVKIHTNKETKTRKKPTLITDEEADKFLLKTIFNVRI